MGDRDPFGSLTRMVAGQTTPFVVNDVDAFMREHSDNAPAFGEAPKSLIQAPLLRDGKPFGRISIENLDRLDAFGASDVRLLTTLASSLSVALENARLFDETQHLLAQTNERAAELAIINSVQQGLAAKLDMQAMYDLVGDKIQEIFDAQVVDIGLYDLEANAIHFPYTIERGVRFPDVATPIGGFGKIVLRVQ